MHKHQIKDKKNEEKNQLLSYLVERRKGQEEKKGKKTQNRKMMVFADLRGQWNQSVCNFEFIIFRLETGLCLQRKKENGHKPKNPPTVQRRKKEHLNVQVDFQTFFIQNKKKRKQSLQKQAVFL